MRVLVVSDLHSNPWSLEAILQREPEFDMFCCAGDLVDYGIAPSEIIARIKSISPSIVVQGNHDRTVISTFRHDALDSIQPRDRKWAHHNGQLLSVAEIDYLDGLPINAAFRADGWAYVVSHQYGPGYETIESLAQFNAFWHSAAPSSLRDEPRRRIIFGHSHRRCVHVLDQGVEWINPGSTSYRRPDDPDKEAHYAIIDNGEVRLMRVPYDRNPLFDTAKKIYRAGEMMETELQDFFFFFGPAKTTRDPLAFWDAR